VFLSPTTAARVKDHFTLSPLGKFTLKNVSEEVEIFEVD
jgi:class 3 adenylate cyclase